MVLIYGSLPSRPIFPFFCFKWYLIPSSRLEHRVNFLITLNGFAPFGLAFTLAFFSVFVEDESPLPNFPSGPLGCLDSFHSLSKVSWERCSPMIWSWRLILLNWFIDLLILSIKNRLMWDGFMLLILLIQLTLDFLQQRYVFVPPLIAADNPGKS